MGVGFVLAVRSFTSARGYFGSENQSGRFDGAGCRVMLQTRRRVAIGPWWEVPTGFRLEARALLFELGLRSRFGQPSNVFFSLDPADGRDWWAGGALRKLRVATGGSGV